VFLFVIITTIVVVTALITVTCPRST